MASFSHQYELDGESMNGLQLQDMFNEVVDICNNMDDIYWSVLVKNYFGKDIEIKITDIEKDKKYKERLTNG